RPRLGIHPDVLRLGDAEVDYLDFSGHPDVDVVGGEVAMDDAKKTPVLVHRSVSGIQPAARVGEDLERNSEGDALGELSGAKPELGEGAALQKLHRDVGLVFFVAQVQHADDVGMVDLRGDLRLVEKHLNDGAVGDQVRQESFHRDHRSELPIGTDVAAEVHLGHAAGANAGG